MRDDRPIPALGFDWLTPLFDAVVEVLGFGRSFKRAIGLAEIDSLRDNRAGKLPLFLEEAGFAVAEAAPAFRSIAFLVGTK